MSSGPLGTTAVFCDNDRASCPRNKIHGSFIPCAKLKVSRVPVKMPRARTNQIVRERGARRTGHAKDRVFFNASAQRVEETAPQPALEFHHVAVIIAIGRCNSGEGVVREIPFSLV